MARKTDRAQALSSIPEGLTSEFTQRIDNLRSSVKTDYLKSEMRSKFVSSETDPADVRRTRAIFKWLCKELDNEATNTRLMLLHEEYNILPRVTWARFRSFCQSLVSSILGDVPPNECLIGTFSGGASTSRARAESHPAFKYLGKAHVTLRALELFSTVVEDIPGWIGHSDYVLDVVPGNVMFTVPKKTDIDRVACKEPDINMWLQKGIGNYIRDSLRRTGINLNDQSINSSLARRGSLLNDLATIDLSSASDSVTRELVYQLLPETWYTLLDSVRSHVTIIDGEEHRNEMFSSMGNGFTFELESLLFYVLARATTYFSGVSGIVSVYGDDIIVPTEIYDDLIWVLSVMGFEANAKKSFSDGPFRESCGGHYYDGYDITPFYLRKPLETVVDVIHIANSLRKWAEVPGLGILDPEVEDIWFWLKSFVPEVLWGGVDLSFKFQLVSPDTPVMRLQEESVRSSTGLGGYFHWLNATWDRTSLREGVATSSRLRNTNRYRFKRVRQTAVTSLPRLFLREIA